MLASVQVASPSLVEINTLFDELIEKVTKLEVLELSSLPGFTISAHHPPEGKSIVLTVNGLAIDLPICAEFVHPHILIPSGGLLNLERLYNRLTPIQKQDLIGTLTTLVDNMVKKLPFSAEWAEASSPVIVVPTTQQGLARDLGDALLRDTELDVLTVGSNAGSNPFSSYNLSCSIDQALRSRVGDITEQSLRGLRQLCGTNRGESLAKDLLHAYEVVNFARSTVSLHRAQWEALFNDHTLQGESLRHVEAARGPLARLLEPGTAIGARRLSALKAYTNILQGVVKAGAFTEVSALLTAAWTTWDRVPFGAFELKNSPFVGVNRDMQTLFTRLTQALQHGIDLSPEDKESARGILLTMFNATFNASKFNAPFLEGLSADEQAPALEKIKAKAIDISERIQTILASQAAPQSEKEQEIKGNLRQLGHPFFGTDKQARVFLSGTKQKPVVHLDPECSRRTEDLTKRKKMELPLGAVIFDELYEKLGYIKGSCCPGCKMPTWKEQETYPDVRLRFRWNGNTSALLPEKFETDPST
jgi:hypothetical protein